MSLDSCSIRIKGWRQGVRALNGKQTHFSVKATSIKIRTSFHNKKKH